MSFRFSNFPRRAQDAAFSVASNRKRLVRISAWGFGTFAFITALAYSLPEIASVGRTYSDAASVPKRSVGVVFWTAKYAAPGKENAFFAGRIAAAAELYKAWKVDCLLVSGDNATEQYNEARTMQLALMDKGVPPERIYLDYAGFRTLDSVHRAKLVFGQSAFTVVTQEFQAERAALLSWGVGADVVAFVPPDVPFAAAPGTYLREIFARMAAFYDLAIARTGPKFVGESIHVETDPDIRPIPDKICSPR